MTGLISLQASLQTALGSVLKAAELQLCQRDALALNPSYRQSGSLRLGRSRTTVSYIYSPPSTALDSQRHNQGQATAEAWHNSQIILADPWQGLIRAHTPAQLLPSGQLLLYPDAVALGAWLWRLATTQAAERPSLTHALTPTFPQNRAPLAARLQLSPLALLQYTYARCHQLARRGCEPVPVANLADSLGASEPPPPLWHSQLAPTTEQGKSLLRALVKLVDQLAVPLPGDRTQLEKALSQSFGAGYQLCEAVDAWLREVTETPALATTTLLWGVVQGLGYLLKTSLQCPDPSSF